MATILIVVDEEAMARWLPEHFVEAGWDVRLVRSEEDALALLEDEETQRLPDAAIVNAVLGEVSGFALIQDIRRRVTGAFIVCASARAGGVARMKALAAGANAYITKPFALGDIDLLLKERGEVS